MSGPGLTPQEQTYFDADQVELQKLQDAANVAAQNYITADQSVYTGDLSSLFDTSQYGANAGTVLKGYEAKDPLSSVINTSIANQFTDPSLSEQANNLNSLATGKDVLSLNTVGTGQNAYQQLDETAPTGLVQNSQGNWVSADSVAGGKTDPNAALYDTYQTDQSQYQTYQNEFNKAYDGIGAVNDKSFGELMLDAIPVLVTAYVAPELAPEVAGALGATEGAALAATEVGTAAAVGAGTGAATSAASGGDIGAGAEGGALSGALGGAGSIAGSALGDTIGSSVAGQAIGQAAGGAASSAATGGNPLLGGAEGAASGAASGYLGGSSGTSPGVGSSLTYPGSVDFTTTTSDPDAANQFLNPGAATISSNTGGGSPSSEVNTGVTFPGSEDLSQTTDDPNAANQLLNPGSPTIQTSIGQLPSSSGSSGSGAGGLASALPLILSALGVGGAAAASSSPTTGVGQASTSTPNTSVSLPLGEAGFGLNPDFMYNPAAEGYSAPQSVGGEFGYGYGSYGFGGPKAGSGLTSGISQGYASQGDNPGSVAQDFGV